MGKERIGIMGGTLDPVHEGHIRMALHALSEMKLSRVLMLPSGNPPHKPGVTPGEDRWRMLCAVCAGMDGLEPSRVELERTGTIYTVDTLSILREKYPKAELYYIIGADTLMELKNWREYGRVLRLCRFLVCPRASRHTTEALKAECDRLTMLGGHFTILSGDLVDVSSTMIRQAIAGGEDLPGLPVQVKEYASAAGLYGTSRGIPQGRPWLEKLFEELSAERFSHTLAVADTARRLALLHGVEAYKAEIAGLLHDCAKCMPLKEQQRIAREQHLTDDEEILASGALLHSAVGAWRAEKDYGVTDPEILSAIGCHTTGKPQMTKLDMIVWLSDSIEPTRKPYPVLEKVRAIAEVSLERALMTSLESTLAYVRQKGQSVHPATARTLEWIRTLPECAAAPACE